jgi:glycosyltransferase involved in cell wall biosynthesis
MTPTVSVLIPAFNAADYLAEALESVLGQTWPATEIIVVDDGSTDRTADVAHRFVSRGVRVLVQRNCGASAARNVAFAASSGDYIQYLDADDVLDHRKIEVQVSRLQAASKGTIASGAWGRFTKDPATATFRQNRLYQDLSPVEFLSTAWNQRLMMQPGAWLVPRSVAERAGRWNTRLTVNDDGEYFARVVLASDQVVHCGDARVFYRSGLANSLSRRPGRASAESTLLSLQLSRRHLLAFEDSPRTRRASANLLQQFVFDVYPDHKDLMESAKADIKQTGTPDLEPHGPPGFHLLRRAFGWKLARRIQKLAISQGFNRAGIRARLRQAASLKFRVEES